MHRLKFDRVVPCAEWGAARGVVLNESLEQWYVGKLLAMIKAADRAIYFVGVAMLLISFVSGGGNSS
jgi:hypothetical protein